MGLYLRPATLDVALDALAARRWTVLAGGTDHFPARTEKVVDENILDITGMAGLRHIEQRGDHWFLPCGATWTDVIEAALPPAFDGLKQAAAQIGGVQIQNMATVVGNLCNASPAADGVPCLLVLEATVELASSGGTRLLDIPTFLRGPRLTARRSDELVTGLRIPVQDGARATFRKLGARRYLVISIAMVALVADMTDDGQIATIRVAVGACGPVATRLPGVEAALAGRRANPDLVTAEHMAPLAPIDDIRACAAYRRAAALELVRRAVAGLVTRAAAA